MDTLSNSPAAAYTHQTVPTQYIAVDGIKYAYRSFGKPGRIPIIFFIHFNGTMDNWDPAITNPLAQHFPIILFDNRGVGQSEGSVPKSVEEMAHDAYAFIQALGYPKVHLLGFSLGGFIAQNIAANHPALVEKLILAGTCTIGGKGNEQVLSHVQRAMKDGPDQVLVNLFFSESATSKRAGQAFMQRLQWRTEDRDPMNPDKTMAAQAKAIIRFGTADNEDFKQARSIRQPTLIVNGNNDTMVATSGSYDLLQHIPTAKLVLWSDSGHGGLFQYHEDFVREVLQFLEQTHF